jgi:hypothetical protein
LHRDDSDSHSEFFRRFVELAVFVDQLLAVGLPFHRRAPFVGLTLGFGFAGFQFAQHTVAECSEIGSPNTRSHLAGDILNGDLLNTVRVAGYSSSCESCVAS